ncbi:MAG: peroxidase-related enzyme [Flavobacteriia bacterium]|nr:peroxidase-related enzyme [Flavobacteriia bacterium]OIP45296.1 MAG: peroxidase [Flavobacteriaceae bacterium CG2_30_31_66]PIV98019.1 MAG: peroxidase [Flavobacteriaceae bacterium CG17_big_fil_post_rev_8_21_14_2_50_31_13]PIX13239.1 MAG: peroxidase [Flavobacteriaceae bacterium CG_4_8_14_3_um_filter_31_8]PIY14115.1 MAG: peroxidase [Flavobacteriaceae bacterium CG_4_10_14_3_um_filter_31_253]PIZ10235.1 MAG: peroxidase [Flavobacteriaceae bacterium CG_4_10_14_0_8_um_filter_31_99]PJC09108.1 MAG: pero
MALIKTIEHHEATGRLKEIYDDLIQKRGKLAEVHKIQSLRPESIVKHIDLYMEIMFSKSELSRAEREMMAVVTSVANKCQYCQIHHSEALNNYWKDDYRIVHLRSNYKKAQLSEKELLLCQFAENLTLKPYDFKEPEYVNKLKEIGLSDAAILDATLVVAYFNFVNRMVLGLGVILENNGGTGYKY